MNIHTKTLEPVFEAIPAELKDTPRWVNWKTVVRDGKPTKPPFQPDGRFAKSDDPATWNTFKVCRDAAGWFDGVGFILTGEDDIFAVDLDKCYCPAFDLTDPTAEKIIRDFNTYAEKSPSGRGFRVFGKGKLPVPGAKKGRIEVYQTGRYVTVTGHKQNGHGIERRQGELDHFFQEYFGKPDEPPPSARAGGTLTEDTGDRLKKAFASKNGDAIERLYLGDLEGYPSQSEADLALCSHLAFWLDGDATAIDQAFRASRLFREKWDRKHHGDGRTYGEGTIQRAVAGCTEFYGDRKPAGGNGGSETKSLAGEEEIPRIPMPALVKLANAGQRGCAMLFHSLNMGRFVFDHAAGRWYEFGGHFWKFDAVEETIERLSMIQKIFHKADAETDAAIMRAGHARGGIRSDDVESVATLKAHVEVLKARRKSFAGVLKNLDNLVFRRLVIEFSALGEGSLGVSGTQWDRHPWLLAVENGVIDLKTGDLRAGRPGDMIRHHSPTTYDPAATCPRFEEFLEQITGDSEVVEFLQRLFGAALIGDATQKQYIAILSGAGRNGKDTLIGVVSHVLGPHVCAPIPAELLLDGGKYARRSSQGPSADLMKLRGLRLAWCNETSQGRAFNAGVAKQLSGGGMMTAREPYGRRNVDWEQSHMIFLLTNSRPHAPVDDYAFWKRIRNVHFPFSFIDDPQAPHERKRDLKMGAKLKEEASGILTWLVVGCLRYQVQGLKEPDAVKKAAAEYLHDVDLLGMFLEDHCVIGRQYAVHRKDLYASYREWANENNHRAVSGNAFGRDMARRFPKQGKQYLGVGLIT